MKKILIKKCDNPLMWYADKVGQRVEYVKEYSDSFISREDSGLTNMILKTDCVLIDKPEIEEWEKLTKEITEKFLSDYFDDIDPYYYYVGDEIGGVFSFADYFFNFSDVLTCYKLNITEEQLFNWYDFCLENHSANISLEKYIISPQEKKKQEEKHFNYLREKVDLAEKELRDAITKFR